MTDPLTGLVSTDIGAVLKGDADGMGQAMDTMVISAVRNVLFGNAGLGGDDLVARDVQRGRDNGMPDYNSMRVAMGLSPVTSFAQITSNVQEQQELEAAYPGGVNTIRSPTRRTSPATDSADRPAASASTSATLARSPSPATA